MIGQRTCRRNTDETRFVLLKIWADLYALDPELFSPELAGPFCQREGCLEKDMSCGCPCEKGALPLDLLRQDYPAALEGCGIPCRILFSLGRCMRYLSFLLVDFSPGS